jgi:CRP-like cAMP-binding protein
MTQEPWPAGTFVGRLDPNERRGLLSLGRREEYRHGSHLLRQGEAGRDVVVLLNGRVQILMANGDPPSRPIATRTRGDVIGELSYLDSRPRSASAVAVGLVTGLRLTRDAFGRFFDSYPTAGWHLARVLADRLRTSDKQQLAAGSDVKSRLAAALCSLARGHPPAGSAPIIVRKTQGELGRMIGAATISVHRALRELGRNGLVETGHRAITIVDLDALGEVAGDRTTMHHLM